MHYNVNCSAAGHRLKSLLFFRRGLKANRGVNLNIYSSNSHGRSLDMIHLETTPSKVAELQIGKKESYEIPINICIRRNQEEYNLRFFCHEHEGFNKLSAYYRGQD